MARKLKLKKRPSRKTGSAANRVYVKPHHRSGRGKSKKPVTVRGYYRNGP